MARIDDLMNEHEQNTGLHEGNPHAVVQGYDVIEELNGKPFGDHEIGPGTKDFDGE